VSIKLAALFSCPTRVSKAGLHNVYKPPFFCGFYWGRLPNFGVASTLAPGTFFSGLIDDVRIYNRAVIP